MNLLSIFRLLGVLDLLWARLVKMVEARGAMRRQAATTAASPSPIHREPDLWYPGSSAFWLDPNLFWPVKDPHREMCWMLLEQRPEPPAPDPLDHLWLARMGEPGIVQHQGALSYQAKRDRALAVLAEANDYEKRGFTTMAAMLRDRAACNLRNALITEQRL